MKYIKNYFKDAKVGDKVIDIVRGKTGKITKIEHGMKYPIIVKFGENYIGVYSMNGTHCENENLQVLYYKGYEPHIEIPEPQKKNKFELEYDDKAYHIDTSTVVFDKVIDTEKEYGRYRQSNNVAKQALKLQTMLMRLHALAEQLGGLKEFEYENDNYFIVYNVDEKQWEYDKTLYYMTPTDIYMTVECAKKICEMLNNGEFSLDVEGELNEKRTY